MKTFAASVGLLAFGSTIVGAVDSSALSSQQSSKPWSVSASLRGFYDSNINSAAKGSETHSTGLELNPILNYGIAGEQTSVNFAYKLSAKWYENLPAAQTDHWDLTHTFEAALSHTFNPRINVSLSDAFVIGQEPDVLQVANSPLATSQRISGDNKRNYAAINLNLQATSLLGFQVGYGNLYYDYKDAGNSALLDRVGHSIHLDSRWTVRPETTGILGYTYNQIGYTADAVLGVLPPPVGTVYSDTRDTRSHQIYVGVEHAFTPDLSAALKGGLEITDYVNDPAASSETSPYVRGSVRYAYRPTSSVSAGVALQRSPTDAFNPTANSYALDSESLVFYGDWVHEIIPHLYGNLNGSVQRSKFNGGTLDGSSDLYYRVGLGLSYEFTTQLSAGIGYNWDKSTSDDAAREYTRSRAYVGATFAY